MCLLFFLIIFILLLIYFVSMLKKEFIKTDQHYRKRWSIIKAIYKIYISVCILIICKTFGNTKLKKKRDFCIL